MQHSPIRTFFNGQENTGIRISLEREIELIRLYGSRVLAITLNTTGLDIDEARAYKVQYEKKFGLPVILPLEEGVGRLVDVVKEYIGEFHSIPA